MKFGEIVAPSMKQLFINRIEDLILSGELKPGEKLPSERELADEMLKLVWEVAPALFQKAGPSCACGVCKEGKMSCGKAAEMKAKYA